MLQLSSPIVAMKKLQKMLSVEQPLWFVFFTAMGRLEVGQLLLAVLTHSVVRSDLHTQQLLAAFARAF